ncbi:MAG: hypothetical protein RL154_224 [Pseudomonadota bacterium]|jgi:hypothetical protein
MSSITLSGVAFMGIISRPSYRDKNFFANEEKASQNNRQEHSLSAPTNTTKVMFTDSLNGANVIIDIINKNVKNLQNNFSTEDFYSRKDGTIRLNGKAEVFVSGWYQDIAYTRNFIGADNNKDGQLSDSEYSDTKNEFRASGSMLVRLGSEKSFVMSADEQIEKSYVNTNSEVSNTIKYNKNYRPTSISDELNTTLRIDKDLNSKITLEEALKSNDVYDSLDTKDIIVEQVRQITGLKNLSFFNNEDNNKQKMPESINDTINRLTSKYKNKKDEKTLAMEAIQKLISANGNESVLSSDEKAAIQSEISKVKQDLKDVKLLDEIA